MENYKNFKNPPIKECVIGIGIKNYFNCDLKTKCIYSEIEKIYPKILKTVKGDIVIKAENVEPQIGSNGYRFSKETNKEHLFIEKNRIAFADTSKYENFDVFLINLVNY